MIRSLSGTKKAVLEAIRMRLSEKEALTYLDGIGYPMKRSTFYRHKKDLEDMKLERLHFIAKIGFEQQHLERIDTLELIQKLMWQNFDKCNNPFQRAVILEKIANIQPFLSSYYEATKAVITGEDADTNTNRKKPKPK